MRRRLLRRNSQPHFAQYTSEPPELTRKVSSSKKATKKLTKENQDEKIRYYIRNNSACAWLLCAFGGATSSERTAPVDAVHTNRHARSHPYDREFDQPRRRHCGSLFRRWRQWSWLSAEQRCIYNHRCTRSHFHHRERDQFGRPGRRGLF